MNILFLSTYSINSIRDGYIYADLVQEFARHGHTVFAVSPTKEGKDRICEDEGVRILRVRNGSLQKNGKVKKLLNLLLLERRTIRAVNRLAPGVKFDLVINMVSNLSYCKTMCYFKKKHAARTYMLLKDIFPQNAVDMDMISKTGVMGIVYRHFRKKEKRMLAASDKIGCMSPANCRYVLEHNPEIAPERVEVCPNSILYRDQSMTEEQKRAMREKYAIPLDKRIFIYGGNLGKPQDIDFVIECVKGQRVDPEIFFLIVGDGTEYGKLEAFVREQQPENMKLLKRLPREDYDKMIAACDVGLIFLDRHFTVPNFPSRLLSYMQAGVPVLACTDENSDVGEEIVKAGFGWACRSDDVAAFNACARRAAKEVNAEMSRVEIEMLKSDYSVARGYEIIMGEKTEEK